jgi:hypothetical protein
MTAMNSNKTRTRALRGEEVNFTEEARRIQTKAQGGQACVVRVGQIVFFPTESGDAWMLDRAFVQPLDLLSGLIEGFSRQIEAAANAETAEDLFHRLEACGQLVRLDPTVEPTMYRCAILSEPEVERLRQVENVVRQGRITHIGQQQITLAEGAVPTDINQIYVDCTADGLRKTAARAIFEPKRIASGTLR